MARPMLAQSVTGDIDGDGQAEVVEAWDDGSTRVLAGGTVVWSTTGWIDGWNRRGWDMLFAIDIDGDRLTEIIIANNRNGWTGVLKWSAGALRCPWGSGSPLRGPASNWNRREADVFGLSQWQGSPAMSVAHLQDGWHATLAWLGDHLGPVQLAHDKIRNEKETGAKEPGDKEENEKEPGEKEAGEKELDGKETAKEPTDKENGKEPDGKEPTDKEGTDKEPGDVEGGDQASAAVDDPGAWASTNAPRRSGMPMRPDDDGLLRVPHPIV